MSKTAERVIADTNVARGIDASESDIFDLGMPNAGVIINALGAAGFVIVPKEPTQEMLTAGVDIGGVKNDAWAGATYRAMIAKVSP